MGGAEGLRRLSRSAVFTADPPAAFQAEYQRVQVGHAAVEAFSATSHSCRQDAPSPMDVDSVAVTYLAEGTIRATQGGVSYEVEQGRLSVDRSTASFSYTTDGPIRLIRVLVAVEALPRYLVSPDRLPVGSLPRTRLAAGYVALARQFMAAPPALSEGEAVYVERALADLQSAVLAGVVDAPSPGESGLEGLRARIQEHIDRNLADPDLGPGSIADAMGVSVRYVHRAFNTGGLSVSRYIRERRLEAVAHTLRTDPRIHRVSALSERFGFSGRDQLSRAFRQRYGMTLAEYQDSSPLPG